MDYKSPTELLRQAGVALRLPLEKDSLGELDAVRLPLAEAVADWHLKLAESKRQMLHPKDKDFTELDRNIMLDAHVGVVRKDYEMLQRVDQLVEQKISLIISYLTLK